VKIYTAWILGNTLTMLLNPLKKVQMELLKGEIEDGCPMKDVGHDGEGVVCSWLVGLFLTNLSSNI